MDSKYGSSSPGGKFSEPLKAMCSRKCAIPSCPSFSFSDPVDTCNQKETFPGGVACDRTQYAMPLSRVPRRTAGSTGNGASRSNSAAVPTDSSQPSNTALPNRIRSQGRAILMRFSPDLSWG